MKAIIQWLSIPWNYYRFFFVREVTVINAETMARTVNSTLTVRWS